MKFRKFIFWIHLIGGISVGLVILSMSVTGMLLAFEPQIVSWSEKSVRTVMPPSPISKRLTLESLVARTKEVFPDSKPTALTLHSDPTATTSINLGREKGLIYLNPYTGEVLGMESKTHKILHKLEEWHRWLGFRNFGKPITGASCAVFLALIISGPYLWWPRQWDWDAFKAIIFFNPCSSGKARDWNWHNVIGFWCAPLLLMTTLTGLVMSYQWANDLLFRLVDGEPPSRVAEYEEGRGRASRGKHKDKDLATGNEPSVVRPMAGLDTLWARAEAQIPKWTSINLRLPQDRNFEVIATIVAPAEWHPNPRSQLTLNASTGEVMKWEPYSSQSPGKRFRSWIRPLHTGIAGGFMGQILVCLASMGAVLLIWTGFALHGEDLNAA